MKHIFLILVFALTACGSLTQQYGANEINRCPSCKKFAVEVQNYHPTTQVIKINDTVVELAPKKKSEEVRVPIDSAQVAVYGYAVVTLSYGGYEEQMRMYPGIGFDLRPWMCHIAEIEAKK